MSFAENLQTIRKEKHISQEDLAEMIGVSRQAVSKWEQGNGYPETEKLIIISKTLNVSLDYLMLGEINISQSNKYYSNKPKGIVNECNIIENIKTEDCEETNNKSTNTKAESNKVVIPTGKITIKSYDGKSIINCYKVLASHVMYKARFDEPKYWLIGVNEGAFWGERSVVLGWYADEEQINKEMDEIAEAISNAIPAYELKYAVKIKNKMLRIKIDDEKNKV
jgi:transcriptional regulator with XRE-family HTH domain